MESAKCRVAKIEQLVPAPAGWRRANVVDTRDGGKAIQEWPIACFALCTVTWVDDKGKETESSEILPVMGTESGLEPWTENDMAGCALVGPGFRARVSGVGTVSIDGVPRDGA